jgi:hypothetical protein
MDQTSDFISQNKSILSTALFLGFLIYLLYIVYSYLYPTDDPAYTSFIKGEVDTRKEVQVRGKMPAIYTGGDFTFSFWMYVDDWDYNVNSYKTVFMIAPDSTNHRQHAPLVGLMTPMQNNLMVRAHTVKHGGDAAATPNPAGSAEPDVTDLQILQKMLEENMNMSMFQTTVDKPCDVKDIPLQRWVCVTIVSSGRVLDVYVDGKLSRSCVLDNVLDIPRGKLKLMLGGRHSFGGRYASVQMWNQQLTPDAIYALYQMGPTQTQNDVFTTVSKWLNINVAFSGTLPGESSIFGPTQSFFKKECGSAYSDIKSDITGSSIYHDMTGEYNKMHRMASRM